MHKMWASDKEICRVGAVHIQLWINEFNSTEDPELNKIALKLDSILQDLLTLHASAKSKQLSPKDL